jgi:hypothetical protein
LAPAQPPRIGNTVASVIDGRLLPGVPRLVHRPTLDGLRRLQPGRVGHVLVVEHHRAALHDRRRVEGLFVGALVDRLRHELGQLLVGVVLLEREDRAVVGIVLDVRAIG